MNALAGTTGLEPATSCVTGMRSNQLNYVPFPKQKAENTKRRTKVKKDEAEKQIGVCRLPTADCLLFLVGGIRLERMTFCL
jgi:hypothetical protein